MGGEQSGHLVLGDYSTTGDGLISALQVLAILVDEGGIASQVCNVFKPIPQILRNINLNKKEKINSKSVKEAIKKAEEMLNGHGRILIRNSGTEPLVRVMVEGADSQLIDLVTKNIVSAIEKVAVVDD